MGSLIKSLAVILGLIVTSVMTAAVIGYVALHVMPCSWFGSGFEGACGFGAVRFVLLAGALLAAVMSSVLIALYLTADTRRPRRPS